MEQLPSGVLHVCVRVCVHARVFFSVDSDGTLGQLAGGWSWTQFSREGPCALERKGVPLLCGWLPFHHLTPPGP